MSKHTPGPWIWGKGNKGLYGAGPDNEVLDWACYEGMWLSGPNDKANARLIAAAPELLKELQELVEAYADGEPNWKQIVSSASAAIAKATGEQA
jgi:hypothetical protein